MVKKFVKRFMDWGGFGYAYTGGSNPRMSMAGYRSTAGPLVNEDTALSIPAFFHGLRLFGQTLGSLHWNLMQVQDRGKTVARLHPVHRLLHDEPNEFQLPAAFRETILLHAIAYGNGYAYIERNGNFRPTALLPLLPDRTYPVRSGGKLVYRTYINNQPQDLEPYEVFHLPGISVNGLTGIPLVKLMADALGLSKAEEQYAAAFFGNGCSFGGFITSPGKLDDPVKKNLRASLEERHAGLGNAFRIGLLEGGLGFTPAEGVDPNDAQLVESRNYQLGDLARIVGLPPHLLFDLSRATFSNIEHLGIEAVTYAFKPWSNKLCQEANRKLLYESEKGAYEACIDLKPLMAGDSKTQAEKDQIRFNCLARTPNEIREEDGLAPIEGGDQLFINTTYLPLSVAVHRATTPPPVPGEPAPEPSDTMGKVEGIDDNPESTNDEPPPDTTAEVLSDGPTVAGEMVEDANTLTTTAARALAPVARDVAARLLRREAKAFQNALGRSKGDDNAVRDWMATHQQETRQIVQESLSPLCESLGSMGQARDVTALVDAFASRTAADVTALLGTDPGSRADESALMLEGWAGQRVEEMTTALIEGIK